MQSTRRRVIAGGALSLLLLLTTLGSSAFASSGKAAAGKPDGDAVKTDAAAKPAAGEGTKAAEAGTAAGQLAELSEGEMQQVTGKHIVIRRGNWQIHLPGPKVCAPFVGCVTVHRHPKR